MNYQFCNKTYNISILYKISITIFHEYTYPSFLTTAVVRSCVCPLGSWPMLVCGARAVSETHATDTEGQGLLLAARVLHRLHRHLLATALSYTVNYITRLAIGHTYFHEMRSARRSVSRCEDYVSEWSRFFGALGFVCVFQVVFVLRVPTLTSK